MSYADVPCVYPIEYTEETMPTMTMTPARPGLVAARERAGLNQSQAAHLSGIHRVQWNRYERGNLTPSVDIALRIARALGTTVEVAFSTAPGAETGRAQPEETISSHEERT